MSSNNEELKNIFMKVDLVRKKHKLSKKKFCELLEISPESYRKYSYLERYIGLETIIKISKTFEISADFFINNYYKPTDIDMGVWLYQAQNIAIRNANKEELMEQLKLFYLLNQVDFKNPHTEKNIWVKLLANPKEETIRALGLVLSKNINISEVDSNEAKSVFKNIIEEYYKNLSLPKKLFTTIFTSEKKYLLEYIDTLSNAECLLILENAPLVIKTLKEEIKAPYSKWVLK